MKFVPIGSVSSIQTGKTPSTADESNFGGDIPFVTPADLDQPNEIFATPRTLTEKGARAVSIVPAHSVLVCCIGSLGKVGYAGRAVAMNQQINAVVFDQTKVFPRFGFYACRRLRPEMERLAPATTVAIISKSKFSELTIPLPSLEEQKRIAAILDQADALRRLRVRALDRLNALGQAIFHEMFGTADHGDVSLESVVQSVDYGLTASSSETADGPKFLRITDIQDGQVNWATVPRCEATDRDVRENALQSGDIVFARTGATTGKSFLVDQVPETAVFASYLIRVRPNLDVRPQYLFQFFQTADYWRQIGLMSVGAAQPGVNASKLKDLRLPLPPLEDQERFCDRMAKIDAHKCLLRQAMAADEALFWSLQQRAFDGRV